MLVRASLGWISCLLFLALCFESQAMDRWGALSQIESGNDDFAVGIAGEISRYQIRPEVWQQYAPTSAKWDNPQDALAVAKKAMDFRCAGFERKWHRVPTDFEFYVLWNAPGQVDQPCEAVATRAKRFCNLIQRR